MGSRAEAKVRKGRAHRWEGGRGLAGEKKTGWERRVLKDRAGDCMVWCDRIWHNMACPNFYHKP